MQRVPVKFSEGEQLLARLDRIPIWPYPWRVLVLIGAGFFFCFFDILTIGQALPALQVQWDVSESLLAWTITASLIGYVIGEFIDGRIADRYGRRTALYISVSLFSVGSILSATSPNLWWLVGWRLISGMGIGAEISGATSYLSEMAPRRIRGHVTAIGVGCGFVSFAVLPFISMALIPNFDWGWRAIFVLGGAIAFIVFLMRRHMDETPRWLVTHGREEEAQHIIEQAEKLATQRIKKPLPPVTASPQLVTEYRKWFYLFKPPYLVWLFLFGAIWSFYYIGNYAWITLTAELYVEKGISLPTAFLVQGVASFGYIIGAIAAIIISDRIERKWLVAIIAVVWSVCLLLVGWVPSTLLIMVCGFAASATIAMFIPVMYTYTAEAFPIWGRATGISLTDGIGHIAAAFCAQIIFGISGLFRSSGYWFEAAFTTMALTGLITMLLLIFGPRRTGRSLDENAS